MDNALGSTVLGVPAEPLSLRLCGGLREGQIVRLAGAKCTIGADPHCTLRLRGPGIRPVHCLILRGQNSAVVRRWSPDTLINGATFEEAVLEPGDRLQCGPAVFQVELAAEGPPAVDSVHCPTIVLGPQAAVSANPDLEALREQLRAERQVWDSERESWVSERQAWESQRREWEVQRRTAEEALDQQRELVERLLAKAHSQLSTINRDMDAWHRQRPPDEEQKLKEEASRIAAERAVMEQLSRDLAEREAQLNRRERQGTDSQPMDAGADALPGVDSAHEDSQPQPVEDAQPTANAWDRSVLEPGHENEAEQSVEQYMADLLRRVGGRPGGESGTATAAAAGSLEGSAGAGLRKSTPVPLESASPVSHDVRKSTIPAAAPRKAPETTSDLASLREVANLHTHAALQTHGKHRARYAAWGKFAVSLTGLSVGVAILLGGDDTVAMTCTAWASIVIGLAWLVQLSFALRNLRRTSPPARPAPSAGAAKAAGAANAEAAAGDPRATH